MIILSFLSRGINRTFWYITCICVFYILEPVAYGEKNSKKLMIITVAITILAVLIFFLSRTYFAKVEIALLRMPWFFVGMLLGQLAMSEHPIPGKLFVALSVSVPIKILVGLSDFPFGRWINGLYAVFLILVYIILRRNLHDGKRIKQWIIWSGDIPLELYIIHVAIRNIMRTMGLRMGSIGMFMICIVVSVPVCFALQSGEEVLG